MKILLIPPIHAYLKYPVLLSVSDLSAAWGYLASSLEQAGHEVFGLQLNNRLGYASGLELIKDKVPKAIDKVKPDLIGLGGICTDYAFLRDTIKVIRETDPKIPIVLGGRIITNDPEIFQILKPDYGIVGEAEEAIVRLCECVENSYEPSDIIPNVWYWREE